MGRKECVEFREQPIDATGKLKREEKVKEEDGL